LLAQDRMKSGEVEAANVNVIEADGRSFNAYADMVRNATFGTYRHLDQSAGSVR
jgi:hypothetical protein